MDKSVEIIKEIVNKLKDQNDSEKELFEELSKVIEKYENEYEYRINISDEDLIRKFYDDENFNPQNITIYEDLKPFDVVTMGYYNEKSDSFETYPFKVINIEDGKMELLGLKLLGYNDWYSVKDMKFKFIYDKPDTDYIIAHGEIPNMNRLTKIRESYYLYLKEIKEKYAFEYAFNLISIGAIYWTNTSDSSDAWYVGPGGRGSHINSDNTSLFYGALPYVVIDL